MKGIIELNSNFLTLGSKISSLLLTAIKLVLNCIFFNYVVINLSTNITTIWMSVLLGG
jgi:hypothetical protein